MKTFIYTLAIIVSLTISFMSYGQYSAKPVGYVPVHNITQVQPITPASFLDLDGYKCAKSKQTGGVIAFSLGLATMATGTFIYCANPITIGQETIYTNQIVGSIIGGVGTIITILGYDRWKFWEREASNIRMAWYVTHNGIAVSF